MAKRSFMMVEGSAFETIDALLEQPYWVVDPLPWRVPAQGEGRWTKNPDPEVSTWEEK